MRGARFLSVALLAGLATYSAPPVLQADPPDVYAFEEPGAPVTSTRYLDGVTEQLNTRVITRPMCASNLQGVTPAQFKQRVKAAYLNAASMPVETIGDDLPTPHAGMTLNMTVTGAPPEANAALNAVKLLFESTFRDPITVNMAVNFQNIGGGGILGATSSQYQDFTYEAGRAAMVAGKDADDLIQDFLPLNSMPFRFAPGATPQNLTQMKATRANYKAAIGSIAAGQDFSMVINTNFPFDFDPSNGVPPGQTCFRSVFVHEILHGLGFVSSVDEVGFNPQARPSILDFFRFQRSTSNPSNFTQFTLFPRIYGFDNPSDDQGFDMGQIEWPMSDGNPNQASHWFQQSFNPATSIGIMQPILSDGVTFAPDYFYDSDLTAMDAIGWDRTGAVGSGDCATCNITFKANGNTTAAFPPNPSCAAGPVSLVSVVDRNFAVFDKVGNTVFTTEFEPFFGTLRTTDNDFTGYRTPRALFDPYLQKFIVSAIGTKINTSNQVTDSWILFAVSKTDRPTLATDWSKFVIKTSTDNLWSDAPALGCDELNLYFSYNMMVKATGAFNNVRQHLIEKTLLSQSDPPTQIPNRFFNIAAEQGFAHVPVISFGTTKTEWFVYQKQVFGAQSQINLFFRGNKTVPGDTSNLTGDFAVDVPTFSPASPARQRQTGAVIPPQLDHAGDRMMSAVARGSSVWAAHTVSGANGAEVRWYEFDISFFPSAPTLKQTGAVNVGQGGLGGQIDNFNPSIMVSQSGDMMLAFSSAGPQNFPSMVYTWRARTDGQGLTRTPELVKAGPRSYLGAGSGLEKWGFYSGLALDPDQSTFWMFNQIPTTTGNWESWFGGVTLTLSGGGGGGGSLPVPSSLQIISPDGGENWVTKLPKLVKWNATGDDAAPVSLFLYKGTTLIGTIAQNLPANAGISGYSWTVGSLTNNAVVTSDPSYRVRVSSVNDPAVFDDSNSFFRITEKVEVEAGVPDDVGVLKPNQVFGPGEQVSLQSKATKGQPPYFYQWSPQDFLSNPNSPNPTASPLQTIKYTLTISDATGASSSAEVNLIAGNPLKANAGADLLFPSGGKVILEGSVNGGTPPYIVNWFDCDPAVAGCTVPIASTIQPAVTPAGTTTYFLRVTDADGTTKSDSVTVSPGFTIAFENEPGNGGVISKSPVKSLYQPGEAVTITAQPFSGFKFSNWSNGASGSTNPLVIAFPNQNLTVRAVYTSTSSGSGEQPPTTNPLPPDCAAGLGGGLMVSLAALTCVRVGRSRRRNR